MVGLSLTETAIITSSTTTIPIILITITITPLPWATAEIQPQNGNMILPYRHISPQTAMAKRFTSVTITVLILLSSIQMKEPTTLLMGIVSLPHIMATLIIFVITTHPGLRQPTLLKQQGSLLNTSSIRPILRLIPPQPVQVQNKIAPMTPTYVISQSATKMVFLTKITRVMSSVAPTTRTTRWATFVFRVSRKAAAPTGA